ncbi:MAG: ABC transporter permease [Azospirillaceae bacterium]
MSAADETEGFRSAALAGRVLRSPHVVALVIVIALLALGEALSPGFASPQQIMALLVVAALLGIIAAGQTMVIIGGREGIDLSVGAMVSLGALIAGNIMDGQNAAIAQALVLVPVATFLVGLLNGVGVAFLRIPPLVMTLGMAGVIQGGLVVLSRGVPSGRSAPGFSRFLSDPLVFGLPGMLFVWLLVAIVMGLVLARTRFGLRIYAIGTNEAAARLTGAPVSLLRVLLFGLSGAFAGFGGVLVLGYTGTSFISVGDQYMLPSIIAVVIGGTALSGGRGGYFGTVAGAILLTVLQSILITLALPEFGRQMIFGATLLVLLLFYGREQRLQA